MAVGNLNILLSDMDRSSKQKIKKKMTSLNDTLDQLDILDIYRAFHPKTLLIHSSLEYVEHSQDSNTYWETEVASTNIRGLKSYQPCFLIIML